DAMREVFSAVVVIGVVLAAVFVPVAFFPGMTGRLYQQFSLTIAFSVLLSVFNAVTLTPALAALLLDKEGHSHGRFFSGVNRVIDGMTAWYVRFVRAVVGHESVMVLLFILLLGATWGVFRIVPTSFVPAEDEGYFITIIQGPAGASLQYTTNVLAQAEAVMAREPAIQSAFAVAGFSFSGAAPHQGIMFVRLKPLEERTDPDQALASVLARLQGQLLAIPGALVIPIAPPAIQGLSPLGGFQFQLLDQTGGDVNALAAATRDLIARASQTGQVVALNSSFTANDPQIVVDIDRDRMRALGLPMGEVTSAM